MQLSLLEQLGIKGHLTISKSFRDGREEVIFDDHNIIVSGMGVALAHLFAVSGSDSILDYQIDRFQIGVGGGVAREVTSTYELSSPVSSFAEYGLNSYVLAASAHQIKNNSVVTNPVFYGIIPEQHITRTNENTVRYTIVLDELACNNLTRSGSNAFLNEIGLFVKNIKGANPRAPILVAYRYFGDIRKTENFSLVFRWSISF